MSEAFEVMKWPLVACLLLPGLLVYLGLHIIRREVIFVDLALAQVATLGTCVAILLHFDPHDWQSYALSFGFTLVGAANHALYFAVPVLMRELEAVHHPGAEPPPVTREAQAIKDEFIRSRGFWNAATTL